MVVFEEQARSVGGKKRNKADKPGHADHAGGGKSCDQKDDQADLRHIYAEQPPLLIVQREQEDLTVQQEHPKQTEQAQSDVSTDGIQADTV